MGKKKLTIMAAADLIEPGLGAFRNTADGAVQKDQAGVAQVDIAMVQLNPALCPPPQRCFTTLGGRDGRRPSEVSA